MLFRSVRGVLGSVLGMIRDQRARLKNTVAEALRQGATQSVNELN